MNTATTHNRLGCCHNDACVRARALVSYVPFDVTWKSEILFLSSNFFWRELRK